MTATADATENDHDGLAQGQWRLLIALCVSSFMAALNFYALSPFFTDIAADLDTTIPRLGLVTTATILLSAGLGLIVGPMSDRFGYRWPLTIGVLAVGINLTGAGLSPSYPVLLSFSIFGGLADAFVFGLPLAIAGMQFHGPKRRQAIGWTIASLSVAPIIGVPIMTAIGDAASWRVALISAGGFAAVTSIFVATSLPLDQRTSTRFRLADILPAYAPLLHHGPTLRLYGASTLRWIAGGGFLTYIAAFLGEELGLATRQVGLVFTIGGIGAAISSILNGRFTIRAPRLAIAASALVTAIVIVATFLGDALWIAIPGVLLFTFTSAVGGFLLTTILIAESPAGTGTTVVLNGSIMNLGAASGAAFGGLLIGLGGYPALGYGLPIFALLAAALVLWPAGR